jgi:hypothetical protein
MQQINLLDASLLPPLRLVSGGRLATLCLAGAALVCGHWAIERASLARALAATGTEATTEPEPVANTGDGLNELRERVAQREALRDLLASDHLPNNPAALLRAVFDAMPPTLWLTEVDVARERTLRISGGALEVSALDPFAERLAAIAALRGVPIHTLRLQPAEAQADAAEPAPRSWTFTLASRPAGSAGGAP